MSEISRRVIIILNMKTKYNNDYNKQYFQLLLLLFRSVDSISIVPAPRLFSGNGSGGSGGATVAASVL